MGWDLHGNIGCITLDRQKALNALNHAMFNAIDAHLKQWQIMPSIKAVIIRAVPGRAFSAGGDIRSVYEKKMKNDPTLPQLFIDEYQLNQLIFYYPKPYIAFLDGITMGGGAGIAIHGSHRIATENLLFAMPETSIGFYPDIGASYFLSRLPHHIGLYLGLTGEKIAYHDCHALGLVDHVIHSQSQAALLQSLIDTALPNKMAVTHLINQWSAPSPPSTLLNHQNEINHCFSKPSVEEMIFSLESNKNIWCHEVAAILKKKSPTSLKVTFQQIKKGKMLDFDACMKMENYITQQMLKGRDFFEGIRALIIDKDQKPRWQPAVLEEVTEGEVNNYF